MQRILVALLFVGSTLAQKIVNTQYGPVQGHTLNVFNGRDQSTVDVFYAIPFADDTSGVNRFASPVPPPDWTQVFVADTIGDACPQSVGGTIEATHPDWDKVSENCLNVNIYTPDAHAAPGTYATMVWLYGGAFVYGANFQYPGHFLATHDVVVVTVNYRLNKFGFAYSGNEAVPGNAGLWDQKMGIEFVVNNIGSFGGDPSRITVFGESAGAASTAFQILSPQSKDLFQQGIMESGSETCIWTLVPPELEPERRFYRAADTLGCNRTTDAEMMECMRVLSWEDIHENATDFGSAPVVDGPDGFLPEMPEDLRAKGDIMSGPIMSGINKDDASPIVLVFAPEAEFDGCCNRTHWMRIIRNRLVRILGFMLDNDTQARVAEGMIYNYSPWPHIYNTWNNRDALGKISTDVAFGLCWNRQVTDHGRNHGPTYAYIFNYRGRNATQLVPEWWGVPHIAEIPYVWGHTLLPQNPDIIEDSLITTTDAIGWTEEDFLYTYFMQELWTNFAKTGNPTPYPVVNPLGETTEWPQMTRDEMNVMVMSNITIETEVGYRQRDYYFWDHYLDFLASSEEGNATIGAMRDMVVTGLVHAHRGGIFGRPADGSVLDYFFDDLDEDYYYAL